MPLVQVTITEGATEKQKEQLVEGMTDLLVSILGKNPASTHVIIEEVAPEHWGIRGKTVERLRAEGAAGISKR